MTNVSRGAKPGRRGTRGLLALWLAALLPCLPPQVAGAATPAPAEPPGTTRIWMRNLVLFPYGDVPAEVSELSGAAQLHPLRVSPQTDGHRQP